MLCEACREEIPSGSPTCPACGRLAMPGKSPPPLDDAIAEVKHAAKDLARASAVLSRRVVAKAGAAARDPTRSATRATRKVAQELDRAAKEVDRILRQI